MNKKKKLFVMCGPAGSGKSSWIANHREAFNGTEAVVSRDVIRFSMLTNKDAYFSKEHEVYKEFVKEIKDALKTSDVVFADATHLSQGSRTKLLRALGSSLKNVKVIAMAMNIPLKIAIAQNNNRTGRAYVPENAIKNMYNSYTFPTTEEGFDEVWVATKTSENMQFTYTIECAEREV